MLAPMETKLLSNPVITNILAPLPQREREFVLKSTIGLLAPSRAATEAGFKTVPKSKKIKRAIAVIQGEMARNLDVSLESIQAGLLEAINIGRIQGEGNTMINGYKELARISGIGQSEQPNSINLTQINFNDLSEMSSEELRKLAKPVLEQK